MQTYLDNKKKYYEPIINERIGEGYTIEYIHDIVLNRGHLLSDKTVTKIGNAITKLQKDSSVNEKMLVFSNLGTYYGFRNILEDTTGENFHAKSTINPRQFKIDNLYVLHEKEMIKNPNVSFKVKEMNLSDFILKNSTLTALVRHEELGTRFDCSGLAYSPGYTKTDEERLESDTLTFGKLVGSSRWFGLGISDWVNRYKGMKEDTPEEREFKLKAKITLEFMVFEFINIYYEKKKRTKGRGAI